MNGRRFLVLIIVVSVLASTIGAVGALAQPAVDNGSDGDTGAPAVPGESESDNDSEGNGSDSANESGASAEEATDGEDSGGPIDVAQGALDAGTDVAGGAATGGAQAAADAALGPVFTFVLDIPTLDIGLTEPGGLHAPEGSPYDVLFPVLYVGIAVPITTVTFGIITFASFSTAPVAGMPYVPWSTHNVLSRGVRAFVAILGGIVFHLAAFSIVHDLFAGFAEQVAPAPSEMIAEMGLLEFSLATAFTGMGLYEMGWDIIKYIGLLYAILWIYIAFFPMISMPFTAAWLYAPRSTLGKFSGYLHVTHLGLLLSKAAVAVQLFAASQLDWSLSFDGVIAAFVSLGLIASALATPPLMLIFMWLSKGRVIAAIGAGAGRRLGAVLSPRRPARKLLISTLSRPRSAAKGTQSGKALLHRANTGTSRIARRRWRRSLAGVQPARPTPGKNASIVGVATNPALDRVAKRRPMAEFLQLAPNGCDASRR